MAAALSLAVLGLSGCAQSGAKTSAEASAENPMVLTLAHGLSETHTVHIAMTEFADKVEERTNGRIQVRILPNGQLGSENENMEQLMAGVISMTKVSAPGLATYNESYHAFGLPYIFDDTEDFYHVMDSDPMQDFFLSSSDDGFVTLTYYTLDIRYFIYLPVFNDDIFVLFSLARDKIKDPAAPNLHDRQNPFPADSRLPRLPLSSEGLLQISAKRETPCPSSFL